MAFSNVAMRLFVVITGSLFMLTTILTGAMIKTNSLPGIQIVTEQDEIKAGEILNGGCEHFEKKEYDEAIELFLIVYYNYVGTESWGKAAYNLGLVYSILKDYPTAIEYYSSILYADVNDREPGASVMEAYRNYRHKAANGISSCYEQLEDYEKALEYAILARDKYRYETWCGTCAMMAAQSQEKRIQRLTLFKEWSSNKVIRYDFDLTYKITVDSSTEYEVCLPMPLGNDNSSFYFINSSTVIEGNPTYGINESYYGPALKIECTGSCSIRIKYALTSMDQINKSNIFQGFSMQDENKTYRYWSYSSYGGTTWRDGLRLSLIGHWIKYPPDWEYAKWDVKECPIEKGWNGARIFDYYW